MPKSENDQIQHRPDHPDDAHYCPITQEDATFIFDGVEWTCLGCGGRCDCGSKRRR